MSSNVPMPTFTVTGFVPPAASAVLAGVQADMNAAFGTTLNFGTPINPTPQGQIADSNTSILMNVFAMFCTLANTVDPAFAFGRMQDAICRIYFIARIPGLSTVVACACVGENGTIIPPGTLAKDVAGNIYYAVTGGTIPPSGTITLQFANQVNGPITCPSSTLVVMFQIISGWDTITNPDDGVLGTLVETRASLEARRQATVQRNSTGFTPSIVGALLSGGPSGQGVPGVLDAYVFDNSNSYAVGRTPQAVIQGSISGTTLTVSSVSSGVVAVGQAVTGSDGLNQGVADGTIIESGSGTTWTVNNSQTVPLTTLQLGGVVVPKNSLYVAAVGGDTGAVAQAIWSKKSPGCAYFNGNTTVTVYDTSVQYPPPGIPYNVVYQIPPALPFVVQVNIADGPDVPSDADVLIQGAVLAAFSGTDGFGLRAKIGFPLYANRFYAGINALGPWAEIVSLFLGTPDAPAAQVTAAMGSTFTGSGAGTVLTVTSIAANTIISVGDEVSGPGVTGGTFIVSFGSGTGGDGTYNTNNAIIGSATMLTASTVLNVTAVASGTVAVEQVAFDIGSHVADGTTVTAPISGSDATGTYRASGNQQNVVSEMMKLVAATDTVVPVTIDEAPTVTVGCIQINLV